MADTRCLEHRAVRRRGSNPLLGTIFTCDNKNKMNTTLEKLIELLDTLRISLDVDVETQGYRKFYNTAITYVQALLLKTEPCYTHRLRLKHKMDPDKNDMIPGVHKEAK